MLCKVAFGSLDGKYLIDLNEVLMAAVPAWLLPMAI
jgi:hypothetical protein